ncbi:hypothetical protein [Leptospira santarosai]|uniref:hypothetical protein n=1 Tax=Leptospira santarosai TaxID=28183 RepID=UPI0002C03AB0|nr:hypothetical protein [Leptospira santarosai]EMP02029.1 putative lipoprotein [Leptospira santarosai str. HAI1380]KXZ29349.1 hypothetical protein AYB33_17475 [Leptospira santarosai]
MYNYKKIIMLLTLILLVSCESLKKDKEDEVSVTDPQMLLLIGLGVNWDTLVRVENQRDVSITAALYDNPSCNPNATPQRPGMPVVYDFGTIQAHSKSIILTIPFTKSTSQSATGRRIELYTKVNAICSSEINSFFMSSVSNQLGYNWKIIPDSPTAFHYDFETRQGSLFPPNLE